MIVKIQTKAAKTIRNNNLIVIYQFRKIRQGLTFLNHPMRRTINPASQNQV